MSCNENLSDYCGADLKYDVPIQYSQVMPKIKEWNVSLITGLLLWLYWLIQAQNKALNKASSLSIYEQNLSPFYNNYQSVQSCTNNDIIQQQYWREQPAYLHIFLRLGRRMFTCMFAITMVLGAEMSRRSPTIIYSRLPQHLTLHFF